jgi:hypothetical protein
MDKTKNNLSDWQPVFVDDDLIDDAVSASVRESRQKDQLKQETTPPRMESSIIRGGELCCISDTSQSMRRIILGAAAVHYDECRRGETAEPLGSLVALCAKPDAGLSGTREDASRGDFIVNA